jgi:hypothetical protein
MFKEVYAADDGTASGYHFLGGIVRGPLLPSSLPEDGISSPVIGVGGVFLRYGKPSLAVKVCLSLKSVLIGEV